MEEEKLKKENAKLQEKIEALKKASKVSTYVSNKTVSTCQGNRILFNPFENFCPRLLRCFWKCK